MVISKMEKQVDVIKSKIMAKVGGRRDESRKKSARGKKDQQHQSNGTGVLASILADSRKMALLWGCVLIQIAIVVSIASELTASGPEKAGCPGMGGCGAADSGAELNRRKRESSADDQGEWVDRDNGVGDDTPSWPRDLVEAGQSLVRVNKRSIPEGEGPILRATGHWRGLKSGVPIRANSEEARRFLEMQGEAMGAVGPSAPMNELTKLIHEHRRQSHAARSARSGDSPANGTHLDEPVVDLNKETTTCDMRQFTFRATKTDELGNKCSGIVTAAICYGGCDTGEYADWVFPHKRSVHLVCRHGARVRRMIKLDKCSPSVAADDALREYHYVDAGDCVCKRCNSRDTTCLGSMTRPQVSQLREIPPPQVLAEYGSGATKFTLIESSGSD